MCNPQLASSVDCIDALAEDKDADTGLLVELLRTLQTQPTLATSALIGQWYGTERGRRLEQVAALELGHEPDDREFWEAIQRISDRVADQKRQRVSNQISNTLANKKPNQLDEQQRSTFEALIKQRQASLGIRTNDTATVVSKDDSKK